MHVLSKGVTAAAREVARSDLSLTAAEFKPDE
jgi:hypothetical protein